MATSAFKSTTKRSSIGASSNAGDSSSSSKNAAHRRSRSLSRFSRRILEPTDSDEVAAPRGRFVNTVRGSGFPEISLDDLAIEIFLKESEERDSESDRRRCTRRNSICSDSTVGDVVTSSQRRGRSVSRQKSRVSLGQSTPSESSGRVRSVSRQKSRVSHGQGTAFDCSGGGRTVKDTKSERRRSVSVVRYQISDSESEVDGSQKSSLANFKSLRYGNSQTSVLQNPRAANHQRVLGRSLSQRDLLKSHEGYSSHSSVLTDDEAKGAHSFNGVEKTIRTVYAQKKAEHPTGDDVDSGLYQAMRKELRHAVEEIKMELEQVMVSAKGSGLVPVDCSLSNHLDDVSPVSTTRRKFATKLEQKRKQDLLAQQVLEEQRGRELSKIITELPPDSTKSTLVAKSSRGRKRSNDRSRMSKKLTEEAEKYFEDFISNVEDTDISSFDGERSDASSSFGGPVKQWEPLVDSKERRVFQSPAQLNALPVEMDGVVLPWLQWETGNDGSSQSCENKAAFPVATKSNSRDAAQDFSTAHDQSTGSTSSHGSWSPGVVDCPFANNREEMMNKFGEIRRSLFDMDEYMKLQSNEDVLFEKFRQQQRVSAGGLLLCNSSFFR